MFKTIINKNYIEKDIRSLNFKLKCFDYFKKGFLIKVLAL